MGITTISGGKASKGGATSADKVSYNNAESGLQATTVQGAIDEVGANLGGFKLIRVSIVPTDATFTNFEILDQSQIQSIIQARENNEKFIVVVEMITDSSMKQNYIGYLQGDSEDKQSFCILLESDFGELFNQYGLKVSFLMIIRYEDASVTFETNPLRLMLTQEEYDAMPYHYPNCEYLIM